MVEAAGLFLSKIIFFLICLDKAGEVFFEKTIVSNYFNIACALNSALITVLGMALIKKFFKYVGINFTGMYANPIVILLFNQKLSN